jgi:Tn3 transposase DDE domain
VAEAINLRALSDHWIELLRLAMSIKTGTVTASVILRKRSAYPRQNGLALALRELGKLGRTLFTLDWLQDPELRRRSHVGLNKGEQQNALRRAVFFNRLGEIRDRSYENQRHRASGLNLLVAAIILWNTTYLQRALDHMRQQGYPPETGDLVHLSPLGWEHISLTGDYHWGTSPCARARSIPAPPDPCTRSRRCRLACLRMRQVRRPALAPAVEVAHSRHRVGTALSASARRLPPNDLPRIELSH